MNIEKLLQKFPNVKSDEFSKAFVLPRDEALEIATFLRDDIDFCLDMVSNVTGVDYLDCVEKVKNVDGTETEKSIPGFLETVYHFYSVKKKWGPLVVKIRTQDRMNTVVPSLTPVWRGAELQEREAFDLFGIKYEGHPDLRRILMWEGFKDYPMRKDYVEPDDYEYEPTPHGDVLEKVKKG